MHAGTGAVAMVLSLAVVPTLAFEGGALAALCCAC
jgi:hypothetical protein